MKDRQQQLRVFFEKVGTEWKATAVGDTERRDLGLSYQKPNPRWGLVRLLLRRAQDQIKPNESAPGLLRGPGGSLAQSLAISAARNPAWLSEVLNKQNLACRRQPDWFEVSLPDQFSVAVYRNSDLLETIPEIDQLWEDLKTSVEKNSDLANAIEACHDPREAISSFTESTETSGIDRVPLKQYAEALEDVRRTFLTTTYFGSGFWKNTHPLVMSANRSLSHRLRNERAATIKRLFMIEEPVEAFINGLIKRIAEKQDPVVIDETKSISDKIRDLQRLGFDMRIAHDVEEFHNTLNSGLHFQVNDSELAIYDDARIHVFFGGSGECITRVETFERGSLHFEAYLNSCTTYFESLWGTATPVSQLLYHVDDALHRACQFRDFGENGLWRYEFMSDEADCKLRKIEMEKVTEIVKNHRGVSRYLDVGTCTARFPRTLCKVVPNECEIIGIDKNAECVDKSSDTFRQPEFLGHQIKILQLDYSTDNPHELGQFDIITCMLGTISYFGESIKQSIQNFKNNLRPNGLLILSNWTQTALDDENILSLYVPAVRDRLIQQTRKEDDLATLFSAVNMRIESSVAITDRLTLHVICHDADSDG